MFLYFLDSIQLLENNLYYIYNLENPKSNIMQSIKYTSRLADNKTAKIRTKKTLAVIFSNTLTVKNLLIHKMLFYKINLKCIIINSCSA